MKFLQESDLKPDEKIAALKSAASIIENVLGAEMLKHMFWESFGWPPEIKDLEEHRGNNI